MGSKSLSQFLEDEGYEQMEDDDDDDENIQNPPEPEDSSYSDASWDDTLNKVVNPDDHVENYQSKSTRNNKYPPKPEDSSDCEAPSKDVSNIIVLSDDDEEDDQSKSTRKNQKPKESKDSEHSLNFKTPSKDALDIIVLSDDDEEDDQSEFTKKNQKPRESKDSEHSLDFKTPSKDVSNIIVLSDDDEEDDQSESTKKNQKPRESKDSEHSLDFETPSNDVLNNIVSSDDHKEDDQSKSTRKTRKPQESKDSEHSLDSKTMSTKSKKRRELEEDERLNQKMMNPPAEEYDELALTTKKVNKLVALIKSSKKTVIITGAGISTAANIPDYRGVDGLYTKDIDKFDRNFDIRACAPTKTHMVIKELMYQNHIAHLISQNCDGLHLRSGIPQKRMSEIHGNMYTEFCDNCDIHFIRPFETSFHSDFRHHNTPRKCNICKGFLRDTIVHAGEKNRAKWPQNWDGAMGAITDAELIIIVGTSGAVLRNYKQLWPKTAKKVLINIQPTMIDHMVDFKIKANCDDVMIATLNGLGIESNLLFCPDCDKVLNQQRRTQSDKIMNEFTFCTCSEFPPKSTLVLDPATANFGCPGWLKNGMRRMRRLYSEEEKINSDGEEPCDDESSDDIDDDDYNPSKQSRRFSSRPDLLERASVITRRSSDEIGKRSRDSHTSNQAVASYSSKESDEPEESNKHDESDKDDDDHDDNDDDDFYDDDPALDYEPMEDSSLAYFPIDTPAENAEILPNAVVPEPEEEEENEDSDIDVENDNPAEIKQEVEDDYYCYPQQTIEDHKDYKRYREFNEQKEEDDDINEQNIHLQLATPPSDAPSSIKSVQSPAEDDCEYQNYDKIQISRTLTDFTKEVKPTTVYLPQDEIKPLEPVNLATVHSDPRYSSVRTLFPLIAPMVSNNDPIQPAPFNPPPVPINGLMFPPLGNNALLDIQNRLAVMQSLQNNVFPPAAAPPGVIQNPQIANGAQNYAFNQNIAPINPIPTAMFSSSSSNEPPQRLFGTSSNLPTNNVDASVVRRNVDWAHDIARGEANMQMLSAQHAILVRNHQLELNRQNVMMQRNDLGTFLNESRSSRNVLSQVANRTFSTANSQAFSLLHNNQFDNVIVKNENVSESESSESPDDLRMREEAERLSLKQEDETPPALVDPNDPSEVVYHAVDPSTPIQDILRAHMQAGRPLLHLATLDGSGNIVAAPAEEKPTSKPTTPEVRHLLVVTHQEAAMPLRNTEVLEVPMQQDPNELQQGRVAQNNSQYMNTNCGNNGEEFDEDFLEVEDSRTNSPVNQQQNVMPTEPRPDPYRFDETDEYSNDPIYRNQPSTSSGVTHPIYSRPYYETHVERETNWELQSRTQQQAHSSVIFSGRENKRKSTETPVQPLTKKMCSSDGGLQVSCGLEATQHQQQLQEPTRIFDALDETIDRVVRNIPYTELEETLLLKKQRNTKKRAYTLKLEDFPIGNIDHELLQSINFKETLIVLYNCHKTKLKMTDQEFTNFQVEIMQRINPETATLQLSQIVEMMRNFKKNLDRGNNE